MNTRMALRKSLAIAPAEAAIRNADDQAELEDAWFTYADAYAEGSAERTHLLGIYMRKVAAFKAAADVAKALRV